MGLLVAKAQVLICKELNVACFISSSIFAHKTLLVFICARFFQHDSVLVLHLGQTDVQRAGVTPSSAREKNPEDASV